MEKLSLDPQPEPTGVTDLRSRGKPRKEPIRRVQTPNPLVPRRQLVVKKEPKKSLRKEDGGGEIYHTPAGQGRYDVKSLPESPLNPATNTGVGALLPSGVFAPWDPEAAGGGTEGKIILSDLLTRFDAAHEGLCGGSRQTQIKLELLDVYGIDITNCDNDGYFMSSTIYKYPYNPSPEDNPPLYKNDKAQMDPAVVAALKIQAGYAVVPCGATLDYPGKNLYPRLVQGDDGGWQLSPDWEQRRPMNFYVLPKNWTYNQRRTHLDHRCASIMTSSTKTNTIRSAKLDDFVDNMCAVAPYEVETMNMRDYSHLQNANKPTPLVANEAMLATPDEVKEKGRGYSRLGAVAWQRDKDYKMRLGKGGIPLRAKVGRTITLKLFETELVGLCNVYFLDDTGPTPRGSIFCHHADIRSLYEQFPAMPITQPPWTLYSDTAMKVMIPGQRIRWEVYMTKIVRAKSIQIRMLSAAEGGHTKFTEADLLDIVRQASATNLHEFCPFETLDGRTIKVKDEWIKPDGVGKQDALYVIAICAASRRQTPVMFNDVKEVTGVDLSQNTTEFGRNTGYGVLLLRAAREFAQKAGIPTFLLSSLRHVVSYYSAIHGFDSISRHGAPLEKITAPYKIRKYTDDFKKDGKTVKGPVVGFDTIQDKVERIDGLTEVRDNWADEDASRKEAVEKSRMLDLFVPRAIPFETHETLLRMDEKMVLDRFDELAPMGQFPGNFPDVFPNLDRNEPLSVEFEARDLLYYKWVKYLLYVVYRQYLGKQWPPNDPDLRSTTSKRLLALILKKTPPRTDAVPVDMTNHVEALTRKVNDYDLTNRPTTFTEAFSRELFKEEALKEDHFVRIHESLFVYITALANAGTLSWDYMDAIDPRMVVRDAFYNKSKFGTTTLSGKVKKEINAAKKRLSNAKADVKVAKEALEANRKAWDKARLENEVHEAEKEESNATLALSDAVILALQGHNNKRSFVTADRYVGDDDNKVLIPKHWALSEDGNGTRVDNLPGMDWVPALPRRSA